MVIVYVQHADFARFHYLSLCMCIANGHATKKATVCMHFAHPFIHSSRWRMLTMGHLDTNTSKI